MHGRIRRKARWLVNCDKWETISALAETREKVSRQIIQDLEEFVFYSKDTYRFRFTFHAAKASCWLHVDCRGAGKGGCSDSSRDGDTESFISGGGEKGTEQRHILEAEQTALKRHWILEARGRERNQGLQPTVCWRR